MNKTMMFLGLLAIGLVNAQQKVVSSQQDSVSNEKSTDTIETKNSNKKFSGLPQHHTGRTHSQHSTAKKRVGVNTERPVASLEISKLHNIPAGQVEGFLLPHLNQTERNAMTKAALVNGIMIFNTTKNCIDWWNGSHWQCTDGTQRDGHGETTYTGTYTFTEDRQFTKDNCPSGQEGSVITYTNDVRATATSTKSQEDANRRAAEDAELLYYEQGQAYANANGTCTSNIPPTNPITLPSEIMISDGQYWIASIYDEDYLPYTAPTQLADWARTAPIVADGRPDKVIDFQGKIPAVGITVHIPVTTTGSNTLPAYSTSVIIPAERTQNNQARVLTLSWQSQAFTSKTKTIVAKLTPNDGIDLNIKKLDLKGGLGSDYRGLELARFKMPKSSTDGATPTNYTGVYEVRAISGIPDKKFGVQTNGKLEHQFLYLPMLGPDGKVWLNNNLGADYSNINSPDFNLAHQAGARDYRTGQLVENPTAEQIENDYRAFGSLFDLGRDSDGHELVRYYNESSYENIHEFVRHKENGEHFNNCPVGWKLPSEDDVKDFEKESKYHLNYRLSGKINRYTDVRLGINHVEEMFKLGYLLDSKRNYKLQKRSFKHYHYKHSEIGLVETWLRQWEIAGENKIDRDDYDWHIRCILKM